MLTLLLLVVLVGVLLILYRNRPETKVKDLYPLKPENIDKIEIWDPDGRIVLQKEQDRWQSHERFVWDADSTRVRQLFETVIQAQYPSKSVSLGKDAAEHYQLLDNQALHIRVSAGAKTVHALFSNLGNSWDYFRYAKDANVYQVNSKVVQHFPPTAYLWRSSQIIHYWEEELKSVRCKYDKDDYTLYHDRGTWRLKNDLYDFEVNSGNYALSKLVSILQNMNTHILADGTESIYQEIFAHPVCEVWITDHEDKVRKLSFANLDNERHMLLIDDDFSVIFEVGFDTLFRFMRNAELYKRISL